MNDADRGVTGADLLVGGLRAVGAGVIFGVPGDTGVAFYDALYRNQGLRHVLARDERHAIAMADAYARSENRLGFAEVSSGGGATYAVGGLGEAFASGVPILVISSDIHSRSRGTNALTETDQRRLYSAVSKHAEVVATAGEIPAALCRAAEIAVEGRPGPAVLILPEDVLDEVWVGDSGLPCSAPSVPLARTEPTEDSVGAAVELLANAGSPVVVAGSGVHWSGAYDSVRILSERLAAPVATTIHGKGAIPDNHPLALGVIGNNGARNYANHVVAEADAVVFVGTRANATDTNSWRCPPRTLDKVVQIDVDPARAGNNFINAVGLVGDARAAIDRVLQKLDPVGEEALNRRVVDLERRRSSWRSSLEEESEDEVGAGKISPRKVLDVVRAELGTGIRIVADPGTPTPNVACFWEQDTAGRMTIIPRGHGPMGYAIPAAIGVAIGRPTEPVVCLTADGSFAMACGELETANRYGLPILFVQMTNNSLGWIKMIQHLYYEGRYFGVEPGRIDAVRVAEACGVRGVRPESLAEFENLVRQFKADPRPLYVDVEVPTMMELLPPVASWEETLAGVEGRPVY